MNQTLHTESLRVQAGDGINDDDIYVIDLYTRRIVTRYSNRSAPAQHAHLAGIAVRPGQAVVRGFQARNLGVKAR